MRESRYRGKGSDRGSSRGGRSNSRGSRSGGRSGGHGRSGGRSSGRRGSSRGRPYDRNPRKASEGGNQRERITIESGHLVLLDQFMLANNQFVDRIDEVVDEDPGRKDEIIRDFGGTVLELEPGTYRIERDPFAYRIVVHHENDKISNEVTEEASLGCGEIYVDTRCLVMIDRELLDDISLLQKYQQLWFNGQDKACRDLLRDNGGAVRYGFQRYGDELLVKKIPDRDVICLTPKNGAVAGNVVDLGGEQIPEEAVV